MNYSAHAILGLKVPKEKLYKEVPVIVNKCKCLETADPEYFAFCPNCGEATSSKKLERQWLSKDIEDLYNKFYEEQKPINPDARLLKDRWQVLYESVCGSYMYIGIIIVNDHDGVGELVPIDKWAISERTHARFVADMKDLGVWDDTLFGLWAVLGYD